MCYVTKLGIGHESINFEILLGSLTNGTTNAEDGQVPRNFQRLVATTCCT